MHISFRVALRSIAATALLSLAQPALSDPLHKIGQAGAWQHEQSGWVFPKRVGEFERISPPYEIDGTYDVGAQYERISNDSRTRAVVHVYAKDSAAAEANFATAKSVPAGQAIVSGEFAASEHPCAIDADVPITCRRMTYAAKLDTNAERRNLYFVETPDWVVNVRTIDRNEAASSEGFLDELPWSTLGTLPGDLHAAGVN